MCLSPSLSPPAPPTYSRPWNRNDYLLLSLFCVSCFSISSRNASIQIPIESILPVHPHINHHSMMFVLGEKKTISIINPASRYIWWRLYSMWPYHGWIWITFLYLFCPFQVSIGKRIWTFIRNCLLKLFHADISQCIDSGWYGTLHHRVGVRHVQIRRLDSARHRLPKELQLLTNDCT